MSKHKSKTRGFSETVFLGTTAKCCECEFQTNSKVAFRLHKKIVHKKNVNPEEGFAHRCTHCFEFFESKKDVIRHSKDHKISKA